MRGKLSHAEAKVLRILMNDSNNGKKRLEEPEIVLNKLCRYMNRTPDEIRVILKSLWNKKKIYVSKDQIRIK